MPEQNYMKESELKNLAEDLIVKLNAGEIEQVKGDLERILRDLETEDCYIDRTYIAKVKDQKRLTKIAEITTLMNTMSNEQIDNIHVYTVNEFDEPNHEAVALDAIIKLSKVQR